MIATHTGAEGLAAYDRRVPDLVILDLDLSDLDGLALCAALRRRSDRPFVVMSGDISVREQVAVFEAGADDCITKPFDAALLRVRLAAILRRARPPSALDPDILQSGDGLVIDESSRTVRRTNTIVLLTPTEWDLLRTFCRYQGRLLTHHDLVASLWGSDDAALMAKLRVHIANLRRKIERDPSRPSLILTEVGVGYRFVLAPRAIGGP
ncbi:MAG: response regulator transcription factor [Gemmatimonadota bacterium]|nr:response regulator transcription factor [Gemmatimonadota bacterium]